MSAVVVGGIKLDLDVVKDAVSSVSTISSVLFKLRAYIELDR